MRQLLLGIGLLVLLATTLSPRAARAQYFGKNKVQYTGFEWKLLETKHFSIYYYETEAGTATDAARMAERSYARLSRVLDHNFTRPIPVVLYASHSQFQQTNILPELIDEGTGGVTEFQKRRVFLPFTGSYAELEHVLSHELVHAFQIDILYGSNPSPMANPFSFQPPGWFMEGMAEYLSLGGVDPNTEMWLRDASLHGYLLPLKDLDYVADIRVYRLGQSIWEYVARRFGEDKVGQVLHRSAHIKNLGRAFESVLGVTLEKLSDDWLQDVRVTYLPQISRFQKVSDFGRPLTQHRKDHSNFNVTPAISPSGDKMAFISDRSLATSLYLASAIDGKSLGRLVKGERTAGFEALRFFTSSSDWSPDGTRLAFPAKSGGNDALYILDIRTRKTLARLRFGNLDAITSPCWSPDGSRIAFTGYQGGQSDLFIVDAGGGNLRRLMADRYADKEPRWSPDGHTLAFSTDRGPGTSFDSLVFAPMRIALYDLATDQVTVLPGMEGSNITPHWSPDGKEILFVSDRTGITNLFVLNLDSGRVRQVSDLLTGISGITGYSPPVTLSRDGRRLIFSAFEHAGWDLYAVKDPFSLPEVKPRPAPEPMAPAELAAADTSEGSPGFPMARPVRGGPGGLGRVALTVPVGRPLLPDSASDLTLPRDPWRRAAEGSDQSQGVRQPSDADSAATPAAANADSLARALIEPPDTTSFRRQPYRTRLSTDFASTGAVFGSNTGLAGQAVLSFSDILGNKNVVMAAGVYGSLLDSDLLLQYSDMSRRTNYGVTLFQFRNDFYLATRPSRDEFQSLVYRGAEVFLSRPFDKFHRVELSLAGVGISEKVILASYYSASEEVLDNRGTRVYVNPGLALVKDTAVYGMTGPIDGTRARLSLEHAQGGLSFTNIILDYRTYLNVRQRYALAWRFLGGSSAGTDPQIFRVGGPFTVRSVDYGDLEGSHLGLMNLEFRFPFIDRLTTAFPLPLDWPGIYGVLFIDAGGAWGYDRMRVNRVFHPFTSEGGRFRLDDLTAAYGAGLRVSLGFLILRYDVAQPTDLNQNLGHARHFFSLGADF